jgi:hypothetical protein
MEKYSKFIAITLCLLFSLSSFGQNKTDLRIKLKKNIVSGVIILTQDMIDTPSSTYVIKYAFDLNGKTLVIPQGCNLEFKRKGSISNGTIIFSSTWLKKERFERLFTASGTLLNNAFDASRYGFVDDTEKLRFIFSQAKDGFSLKLEPKTYRVNSLKGITRVSYDSAFAQFIGLSNLAIVGDKTIIEDSASKSLIGNYLYSFLQFDGCNNAKVKDVTYRWTEHATLHPKVEGIVFLRTFNECRCFDISISVKNAGRAIYSGRWNDTQDPGRGICDSKLSVVADHVGYPLAIEKGDNLEIQNRFVYAHRGTYLAGVTNSKVYIEGKEAYSTRVNLLLTDASDKKGTYFCDGIKATVIDTGSKEMMNSVIMAQCNTYPQSYDQFSNRKPYIVKNIEISLQTPRGSSTSFEGLVFTDLAQIGDTMNISVSGNMDDEGNNSRLTRLKSIPFGTLSFISVRSSHNYVIIDAEIPNGTNILFEKCPNIEITIPSQARKTSGSITFSGCSFLRNTRSDKLGTGLFPVVNIHE